MSFATLLLECEPAVPPAIDVTPFGSSPAPREAGLLGLEEIVFLAFAAFAFADEIIFLKKPVLFGFGDVRPPNRPPGSATLPVHSVFEEFCC